MNKGLSITDLKKMDKREKVTVYAGGEVRQITAGHLLKLKQESAKKKREALKRKTKGDNNMSKLYFFYGVMGARKSAEAFMTAYNYDSKGLNPFCIKPIKDTRAKEGYIESRIQGLKRRVDLILDSETSLYAHINSLIYLLHYKIDVIIVDEVQFLSEENIWDLARIVDHLDIPVMCYGLKLNFKGEMFPASYRLMCLADELHEIKTMVKDEGGNPVRASMCFKYVNGEVTMSGNQIQIGGDDLYEAVSRKTWTKKRRELGWV